MGKKLYEIWLDTPFKKVGKCFRQVPRLNVTPELLNDLEKARGEELDEPIKEKLKELEKKFNFSKGKVGVTPTWN